MRSFALLVALAGIPIFGASAEDHAKSLYASCVACHGANGAGNLALNAPSIAGQDAAYLARQLTHFKNGIRGSDPKDIFGMQMKPMAGMLADDAAVAAVSSYIAGLPAVGSAEDFDGDLRNGENLYNGACGACHGGKAQGNAALNSPALANLDSAYLKRQYSNFGAGVRGTHSEDKYGRQMKMMSSMLTSDEDLRDVIGFITSNATVR